MHEAIVCNSFVAEELHNSKGTTAKERKKERKKKEGKCPTRKMNSKGLDLDAKDEKNVHPVLRL
jgi:hypothetical protein